MTAHDFIAHVAAHAGVPFDEAGTATHRVLAAIASCLTDARRRFVADELPPELAFAALDETSAALPLEERLLARGASVAHARELIASVCHVLAEQLSHEALAALRAALPADLAALLAEPAPATAPERVVPGTRGTLARGKPGSQHAIADTPAERAHTGSVAADNPHAATKLSSSPGTTQERDHRTLAEARGERRRPS